MARYKIILVFLLFANLLFAQDTIFWQNGDTSLVKVEEVDYQFIKYHKLENLQGPVYTVPIDKIAMIIYDNGTKDVFAQDNAVAADSLVVGVTAVKAPALLVYKDDSPVSYNGEPIDELKYLELARENCSYAYSQYTRGKKLKTAGIVTMSIGAPMTLAGILMFTIGAETGSSGTAIAGSWCLILGCPTLAAGIPLYCVGKDQKRRSFENFNQCIKSNKQAVLQLNINSNNVGLAMTF